jgi:hypothetical protein
MREERRTQNKTFTGLDAESQFKECASQYPLDDIYINTVKCT